MKTKTNANEVEERIKKVIISRGKRRKKAVSMASRNLYNYLKRLNYNDVTRRFLGSFFSDDICQETRRRVLKVILNELKKEGKIKEEIVFKNITYFKNCPLFSQDYGSYSIMMEKNNRRPKHLQGVYSMSSLSVRRVTELYKVRVYVVL